MAKFNFKDFYLRILYWFVSYKKEFKKWWIIAITAIDLLMIVYVIVSVLIFISETPKYNRLIVNSSQSFISAGYRVQNQPEQIVQGETRAIPVSLQKYDLVAKINNPNEDWGIRKLKYKFVLDGTEEEERESFILPNEEKYLFQLGVGYSGTEAPQNVEVKLYDLEWQRISDKKVIDDILFESSKVELTSSSIANTNQTGGVSHLTANIKNKSVLGFWEVGVQVIIVYNDRIVAVNYTVLRQFSSFEEKAIDLSWFYSLPENSEVIIKPEVNVFAPENFM